MEAERKLFRIAGIIYGIMGVLFLNVPTYGLFLIVCGIYFYAQASEPEEMIYKNRAFHYIIATIGIANIVGSVLVYIAQDGVSKYFRKANGRNGPPKFIYKRDKESQKIDLLIKLGVAMIFVAGLLFATTSWHFINDYIKAFGLISFGLIFLGLSVFTESKLQLYRSSYMYWLLSMSLFLLTIVGILYFGIFGSYLTYGGAGSYLAYSVTFATAAGFVLTTYFKYPKKYLLFFCCGFMFISLSYLLKYANLSQMTNITVMAVVVMILNIFSKKQGAINTFSKILSYVLFGAILVVGAKNNAEGLVACLANLINLNYLTWIDKKKDESTMNVIISYGIIIFGLTKFTTLGDYNYIMIGLLSTIYSLCIMGNLIPTKQITKRISTWLYSFIMAVLFLSSVTDNRLENILACLCLPVILFGVNYITKKGLFNVEKWELANYIQPFIIFMMVEGIIVSVNLSITTIYTFAILSIIFSLMHFCYRNNFDKAIVGVYAIISVIIGLEHEIQATELYASIMLILSSLYLFARFYLDNKNDTMSNVKLLVTYLLLLTTIYLPFVYYNILDLNYWISTLGYIALIVCILPFINSELLKRMTYVYLLVPLTSLFNQPQIDSNLQLVLTSFEKLYLVFLFLKFFIKDTSLRNVILIIGVIVSCASPFVVQSVYTGIYIGILGILLIIQGYTREDAYPIFITGIIMTAANIIYYLKDVWKILPFWLYLLLGGLIIIVFATNKEIQKQKENKSKK